MKNMIHLIIILMLYSLNSNKLFFECKSIMRNSGTIDLKQLDLKEFESIKEKLKNFHNKTEINESLYEEINDLDKFSTIYNKTQLKVNKLKKKLETINKNITNLGNLNQIGNINLSEELEKINIVSKFKSIFANFNANFSDYDSTLVQIIKNVNNTNNYVKSLEISDSKIKKIEKNEMTNSLDQVFYKNIINDLKEKEEIKQVYINFAQGLKYLNEINEKLSVKAKYFIDQNLSELAMKQLIQSFEKTLINLLNFISKMKINLDYYEKQINLLLTDNNEISNKLEKNKVERQNINK